MARPLPAIAITVLAAISFTAATGNSRAEGRLILYDWTSYFPPDLLARFETETGIEVTTEYYESNEALLANVRAGAGPYDVIVPTDYMVKIMIDEGLLQPIDAPGMANFKNVKPPFDHPWYDPDRKYTAPYLWGTGGFVYDSAQVEGGRLEESWGQFFHPRPELVGKVTALDYPRDLYQAAAFYLGVDPCTEDAPEAQKILDLLLAQKPKLAWYASYLGEGDPFEAIIDSVVQREIGLFQYWDGGGRRLKRIVPTAVYVIPEEGSLFSQDNYAIPYGALKPENARIFINRMMDPKNAAEASNYTGYTNAIAGSENYMDASLIEDQSAELTPAILKRLRYLESCSQAALNIRERVWARLWPRTVK